MNFQLHEFSSDVHAAGGTTKQVCCFSATLRQTFAFLHALAMNEAQRAANHCHCCDLPCRQRKQIVEIKAARCTESLPSRCGAACWSMAKRLLSMLVTSHHKYIPHIIIEHYRPSSP